MPNLSWNVTVDGRSVSGTEAFVPGIYRVRCDAPAGTVQSVTASLPWKMGEEERLFMNGYQTWTYCPEYKKWDKHRGLNHVPKFIVNKFGLDRSGDYLFVDYPNRRGCFHGFSYCYFRKGNRFRLIGSLDEKPGYTIFRYDSKKALLTVERDCAGVAHSGGEFPAFDLYYGEGTEAEVFDGWFSNLGISPRTGAPIAGYSSWYNRYQNIRETSIVSDLNGCQGLLKPGDLFQVDDGWESFVGDWTEGDKEKFPGGMKAMAERIHNAGFRAGLWLAPFVCETKSALYREHPDWLLKVDGKPWYCGCNWSGFYALDIDNPQVQSYLAGVFDRVLNDWGFDLVKLDFLYAAAPVGNRRESRGGRMTRAVELLRQWCPEKLILGCGVPVMPAFGLVDYCRISCDVSLSWDDVWYMRPLHLERVSTKQAIGNTVFRRQLNGRAYLSDPDVFFLREENLTLTLTPEQKEALAQVNALLGGVFLTSDDPSKYTPAMVKRYRELLALRDAENIRVEADGNIAIVYTQNGETHRLILPGKAAR